VEDHDLKKTCFGCIFLLCLTGVSLPLVKSKVKE
jgi:hypothetical protein